MMAEWDFEDKIQERRVGFDKIQLCRHLLNKIRKLHRLLDKECEPGGNMTTKARKRKS